MFIQEYLFDPEAQAGLTVYLHEEKAEYERVGDRPFVLVIPGGGYSFAVSGKPRPIALNFAAQGFHSGVLRYHRDTSQFQPFLRRCRKSDCQNPRTNQ